MNLIIPYKDKLYRFALSIIKNAHDAEEVIQDLLVKIWKKQDMFTGIENKEAWCMTVTRNLAYDKIRSRKPAHQEITEMYQLQDVSATPHQIVESKDELNSIKKIMQTLPEELSEVIQLREIEECSYQEIADITGWNLNKVKVSIHRARKMIRHEILKSGI